ncbi:hypothetical protein GGI01_002966 [Coemansia sp. RSA 376]|nr:hypothetical protein GGI01_002966 [Coemansia sp. RSA 376]
MAAIVLYKSVFAQFAICILTLTYIFRTIVQRVEVFGIGTTHENTNTTGCYSFGKDIPQVQGCESIQVDPRTGFVYLACGNRHARTRWLHPDEHYNPVFEQLDDHILVLDEKNTIHSLKVLERNTTSNMLVPFSQDFRVHGFDIYWDNLDPTELTFMFVNHQRKGGAISIFKHRLGAGYIEHVKTVKSPLLFSPNDVVATSRSTFYATNDLQHKSGILHKIEVLLGMPWGHIVYYGPEGITSKAYSGIAYPNGIARSPNGALIYVSASSEPSIYAFRPEYDGSLQLAGKTTFRGFVPDNISVDAATGELLVSGK